MDAYGFKNMVSFFLIPFLLIKYNRLRRLRIRIDWLVSGGRTKAELIVNIQVFFVNSSYDP